MTSKKSAKKPTTADSTKAQKQGALPHADLPAGEAVTRYELLGACDFLLVDPGERLPAHARKALFDALKPKAVQCVLQCEGYVFNIVTLPYVEFMDRTGKVAESSGPAPAASGTSAKG